MTSFLNYVTATLRALFAWRGSCNEFITSKTFLLQFVNDKTCMNIKAFVGRLANMVGKRDVRRKL